MPHDIQKNLPHRIEGNQFLCDCNVGWRGPGSAYAGGLTAFLLRSDSCGVGRVVATRYSTNSPGRIEGNHYPSPPPLPPQIYKGL
jgi:hypothetical protein